MSATTARCACCADRIDWVFAVRNWRAAPQSSVDFGECGSCRSLTLLGSNDRSSTAGTLTHVEDPVVALRLLASDRSSGDAVAMSIPIAEGPVWERYRDNWYGLDPPNCRCVPTLAGLSALARAADMRVVRIARSCPPDHVVASEMIVRLASPDVDDPDVILGADMVRRMRRGAARIDRRGTGSLATVVFGHRGHS